MCITRWQELFKSFETQGQQTYTATDIELDSFEQSSNFLLPKSYRSFSKVFGPGVLCDLFKIGVPGYVGPHSSSYDLQSLHDWVGNARIEYEEYCPDPIQFRRGYFFARDIISGVHVFWDKEEVTNTEKHECAIYFLHRDWEIEKAADTYWEFVTEVCFENARHLYDEPNDAVFKFAD